MSILPDIADSRDDALEPEEKFWPLWPACLNSIKTLYGQLMELPDNRFEALGSILNLEKRENPPMDDIRKFLSGLWDFDRRFHGDPLRGHDDYEWSVYSLCFLCKDKEIIEHLLNIYVPLHGEFISKQLGENFVKKITSTFADDVGHYLWDVQGLILQDEPPEFDWHINRNSLSIKEIEDFLLFAGLAFPVHPDFPPRKTYLHFTAYHSPPFDSMPEYIWHLKTFYEEQGYDFLDKGAEETAARVSSKTILRLKEIKDTLSGDDSELKNAWEEICIQIQSGESTIWDAYDETARGIVSGFVAELKDHEKFELWIETDQGIDWLCDDGDETDKYVPILEEDMVQYIVANYLYEKAGGYSNHNIQAYLDRQAMTDT